MLLLFVLILNSRQYWGYEFGTGINEKKNPIHAVEFMRKMKINGNLYSPQMEAHNYILFEMNPEIKVFIDGRIPLLYPISFLKMFNTTSVSELEQKRYKIDLILITNGIYNENNSKFVSKLMESDQFKLVHFTENDALFVNELSFAQICKKCIPYEFINPWKMLDDIYVKMIKSSGYKEKIEIELNFYKKTAPQTKIKSNIVSIFEI